MTKSYFTPGITSAGLSSKPVLLDSVITSSRVYLRFNYFAGHDKLFQNFYQLQFGYKTSLKF